MRFRLTSRSMTLNDCELLYAQIFEEFRVISQILEAITAKLMEIATTTECHFKHHVFLR